jgi:hypothetical protein
MVAFSSLRLQGQYFSISLCADIARVVFKVDLMGKMCVCYFFTPTFPTYGMDKAEKRVCMGWLARLLVHDVGFRE